MPMLYAAHICMREEEKFYTTAPEKRLHIFTLLRRCGALWSIKSV
jgi:hypothetical protein